MSKWLSTAFGLAFVAHGSWGLAGLLLGVLLGAWSEHRLRRKHWGRLSVVRYGSYADDFRVSVEPMPDGFGGDTRPYVRLVFDRRKLVLPGEALEVNRRQMIGVSDLCPIQARELRDHLSAALIAIEP